MKILRVQRGIARLLVFAVAWPAIGSVVSSPALAGQGSVPGEHPVTATGVSPLRPSSNDRRRSVREMRNAYRTADAARRALDHATSRLEDLHRQAAEGGVADDSGSIRPISPRGRQKLERKLARYEAEAKRANRKLDGNDGDYYRFVHTFGESRAPDSSSLAARVHRARDVLRPRETDGSTTATHTAFFGRQGDKDKVTTTVTYAPTGHSKADLYTKLLSRMHVGDIRQDEALMLWPPPVPKETQPGNGRVAHVWKRIEGPGGAWAIWRHDVETTDSGGKQTGGRRPDGKRVSGKVIATEREFYPAEPPRPPTEFEERMLALVGGLQRTVGLKSNAITVGVPPAPPALPKGSN